MKTEAAGKQICTISASADDRLQRRPLLHPIYDFQNKWQPKQK